MVIPKDLLTELKKRTSPPAFASPLAGVTEELLSRYPGVEAVLFYGSCLEKGDPFEGLVDLYLLVRDYREAYKDHSLLVWANRLLPPNVFFFQTQIGGRTLRVKYALMELAHFKKATSPRWFHSYFWGRFCQPTAILYASNEGREELLEALAQAVLTFLKRTIPMAPPMGDLKDLWLKGLRLSYRAELRPEPKRRLEALWQNSREHFLAVTQAAAKAMPFAFEIEGPYYRALVPEKTRRREKWAWRLRLVQGKGLSVLRLMKASFTFQGGVDYALWKIERHRGLRLEVSPFFRRHPLLALLFLGWKVLRLGGVK